MYKLRMISDNGNEIEFGFDSGFVISQITDLSAIAVTISLSQGIGQVGGTVQGESVQPKDVVISGEIVGSIGYKRQHLIDTVLPNVGVKLIYNDTWELETRPLILPQLENYDYNSKFQFTLRAAFPYWRMREFTRTLGSGIEPKFKLPFFSGEPFILGQRIERLISNFENKGNVPANFSVTFKAITALDNPKITKVDTLEIIRIKRHMVAGEMITVNMMVTPMTVTSSIAGNIFGNLDLDSVPFKLERGDNLIQYSADTNIDGLDYWINFRPAVTGPYNSLAV